MPMCDAYIPTGVLEPEVEQKLLGDFSLMLAEHEMRRTVELMDDPDEIEQMRQRARMLAWTFAHHTDHYFAGAPAAMPTYKFEVSVPEGQLDDSFRESVMPDAIGLIAEAEGGRFPHPEARVWVLLYEVPDGNWGAGDGIARLKRIVDFIAPGWGDDAAERLERRHEGEAAEVVARAERHGAAA